MTIKSLTRSTKHKTKLLLCSCSLHDRMMLQPQNTVEIDLRKRNLHHMFDFLEFNRLNCGSANERLLNCLRSVWKDESTNYWRTSCVVLRAVPLALSQSPDSDICAHFVDNLRTWASEMKEVSDSWSSKKVFLILDLNVQIKPQIPMWNCKLQVSEGANKVLSLVSERAHVQSLIPLLNKGVSSKQQNVWKWSGVDCNSECLTSTMC